MNYDLFIVSWLLVSFIIIAVVVYSMQVYYIFLYAYEAMLWMYYFCVLFLFLSPQTFIVGSFLFCLFIFLTLEAWIYTFVLL